MGVQGAFAYLEAQGIGGSAVDVTLVNTHIHVDILSVYFAYIIATMKSLLLRPFKGENPDQPLASTMDQLKAGFAGTLSTLLHHKLGRHFNPARVTLHVDGAATLQKAKAHTERANTFQQCKTRALTSVTQLQQHLNLATSNNGAPVSQTATVPMPMPAPAPRSRVKKLLRSYKAAIGLWRSARSLDEGVKTALAAGLGALGWKVCNCTGEADVCIAGQQSPVIVATSDSDFLFLGVSAVLRLNPMDKSAFLRYNINEIYQKLGVIRTMWSMTAIVSSNDYTHNVRGCGFVTNLKIIKAIPNARMLSGLRLLEAYCTQVQQQGRLPANQTTLDPWHFDSAMDIFIDQSEDLEPQPVAVQPPENLDESIRLMVHAVNRFFTRNRAAKHAASAMAPVSSTSVSVGSPPVHTPGPSTAPLLPASTTPALTGTTANETMSYRQMMSSNKYRARIYTMPPPIDGAVPQFRTRSKKKKGKKRKGATLFNPSSRKARATPSATAGTGTSKSKKPAAVLDQVLDYKFATIAMNCGTLSKQLSHSIVPNLGVTQQEGDSLRKPITTTIEEMVRIATEATRCAQQAIASHIAHVFSTRPDMTEADITHRKVQFAQYSGFHNNTFFKNLLHDMYTWHDASTGQSSNRGRKRTTQSREPARRKRSPVLSKGGESNSSRSSCFEDQAQDRPGSSFRASGAPTRRSDPDALPPEHLRVGAATSSIQFDLVPRPRCQCNPHHQPEDRNLQRA